MSHNPKPKYKGKFISRDSSVAGIAIINEPGPMVKLESLIELIVFILI